MIKTTDMLLEELNEYAAPRSKLFHMVKYGEIFTVVDCMKQPLVHSHIEMCLLMLFPMNWK